MDLWTFLVKGLLLGFSVAVPVGPIGVLCIRRTLHYGRVSGFMSGLGAAVADVIYGAIAAFGLTAISDLVIRVEGLLRITGGLFLVFLAYKIYLSPARETTLTERKKSVFSDFASAFLLTLTNPLTILAFLAIFAAIGLTETGINFSRGSFLILGIFLGSTLWWLILSEGLTVFRKKLNQKMLIWINRSTAIIIGIFGIIVLISSTVKII